VLRPIATKLHKRSDKTSLHLTQSTSEKEIESWLDKATMRTTPLVGPWLWASLMALVLTTLSRERGVLEKKVYAQKEKERFSKRKSAPKGNNNEAVSTFTNRDSKTISMLYQNETALAGGYPHRRSEIFPSVDELINESTPNFGSNDTNTTSMLYWDENETVLPGGFRIHTNWHPLHRSDRFPTVKERVKLYMSNWYHPMCKHATDRRLGDSYKLHFYKRDNGSSVLWPSLNVTDPWDLTPDNTEVVDSVISPRSKFLLDRRVIEDCARSPEQVESEGILPSETQIHHRSNMQLYCIDIVELMDLFQDADNKTNTWTPMLAFFGDSSGIFDQDLHIPFFAKHRAGTTKENIDAVAWDASEIAGSTCWKTHPKTLDTKYYRETYRDKFSPIIWRLNSHRHFLPLEDTARRDTPWEEKMDLAIWRGVLTGFIDIFVDTDIEVCLGNLRCRFVLAHANSELIDCGLTDLHGKLSSDVVNGTNVTKSMAGMRRFQRHKVIISLEGNDVASGLKWNLLSGSVVLMPPPTRTSWAMEELLQPWVHYVPMLPDGSNAENMVQWILDNDREARRIAERATLFMYDLVFHPDAKHDELNVKREIARRYRALW